MKNMIWSNNACVMGGYVEDLMADDPNMDNDLAWATANSVSEDELWSAKLDLGVPLGDLIVIADLGLWNGRRKAVKVIPNATIADAVGVCVGDYIDWYVEDGEMRIEDVHHDGTNRYLFRTWKDGVSDLKKGVTLELIKRGFDDKKTLDTYTRPLGPDVSNVYGWEE